jgi:hypothetical protein
LFKRNKRNNGQSMNHEQLIAKSFVDSSICLLGHALFNFYGTD